MVELYVNLFCVFQVFSKCVVILPSFRKQKREKLNKIFLKRCGTYIQCSITHLLKGTK